MDNNQQINDNQPTYSPVGQPLSAFEIFVLEYRESVRYQNPRLDQNTILQKLKIAWDKLPGYERTAFAKQSERLAEKYLRNHPNSPYCTVNHSGPKNFVDFQNFGYPLNMSIKRPVPVYNSAGGSGIVNVNQQKYNCQMQSVSQQPINCQIQSSSNVSQQPIGCQMQSSSNVNQQPINCQMHSNVSQQPNMEVQPKLARKTRHSQKIGVSQQKKARILGESSRTNQQQNLEESESEESENQESDLTIETTQKKTTKKPSSAKRKKK